MESKCFRLVGHHPKQFLSVAERGARFGGRNAFPENGEKRNDSAAEGMPRVLLQHAAILDAIKIRARGF